MRGGILLELAGVIGAAAVLSADVSWIALAVTLSLFGLGAGMASSQLTNVILSDVPPELAGSGSGISTTNSALAAALGVAVLGSVLRVGTLDPAVARSALLTAAGLLIGGSLASLAIPTRQRPNDGPAQPLPAPNQKSDDDVGDRRQPCAGRT